MAGFGRTDGMSLLNWVYETGLAERRKQEPVANRMINPGDTLLLNAGALLPALLGSGGGGSTARAATFTTSTTGLVWQKPPKAPPRGPAVEGPRQRMLDLDEVQVPEAKVKGRKLDL